MIQSMNHFDFLVIGGGSGGVRAARRAAGLGVKTALFEKGDMGGTCVLKGCIPKKLMWYGARFLEDIDLAKEYGWSTEAPQLNWAFQRERRNKEVQRLSAIYQKLLDDSGVHTVNATAVFEKEKVVQAGGKLYTAPHILIAVGGTPYRPSLPGVEHTLVSDDVFQLEKQPSSLLVVGAGYIALEFAGIFQSMGTSTTLLCRKDKVLTHFDEDVRSFFQEQAKVKGLNIVNNFEPVSIVKNKNMLTLSNKEGKTFSAEQVLFATGRKALTESLNLEKAGIQTDSSGSIKVSDKFETSCAGVYAVGDCSSTPFQLTPVALAESEILVQNLFGQKGKKMDYRYVPSAVFSNPNIAQVGWTEKTALEKGFKIQVFESSFRPLKYTINPSKKSEKIYMKMIVDQKTNQILGCHIVGEDSPEIIQGVAVAMVAGATKSDFDRTIGLHPSSAEELCTLRTPR